METFELSDFFINETGKLALNNEKLGVCIVSNLGETADGFVSVYGFPLKQEKK